MANIILENGRDILRISNISFELLHEEMEDIITKENIKLYEKTSQFLELIDQKNYGVGMICEDINYFDNSPEDLSIFIYLVKKSTQNLLKRNLLKQDSDEILANFIHQLDLYHKKITSK